MGLGGKIILCSGSSSDLRDDSTLAGFLGCALAPIIAKHHEENIAYVAATVLPISYGIPLFVTAFCVSKLWIPFIPYTVFAAYVIRTGMSVVAKFDDEKDLIALKLQRQLEYDYQPYLQYRERDLGREQQHVNQVRESKFPVAVTVNTWYPTLVRRC